MCRKYTIVLSNNRFQFKCLASKHWTLRWKNKTLCIFICNFRYFDTFLFSYRKHCQDLVSLETKDEAAFVYQQMQQGNVKYVWTSGRKCNFDGCDRADLQPPIVNGWFWSGSSARIPATNSTFGWRGDWSPSGGGGSPQPDNREFAETRTDEACIAILNNFYNDGITWHDVACHHVKPWVCEDSAELLRFARFNFPQANIP